MKSYKWYHRTYERFNDAGRHIKSGEVFADNDTKAKRMITKESNTACWNKNWINISTGFKKYNGDGRIDVDYHGMHPPTEQLIIEK